MAYAISTRRSARCATRSSRRSRRPDPTGAEASATTIHALALYPRIPRGKLATIDVIGPIIIEDRRLEPVERPRRILRKLGRRHRVDMIGDIRRRRAEARLSRRLREEIVEPGHVGVDRAP